LYEYKTIKQRHSFEIIEKKSRFIAHVMPVGNENDALSFINAKKTEFWDASHNVYAYVLKENSISRYSDDGEPLGTAGIPALNVIQKEELLDVCVVVTRYFGGIQLGAGGLVRAYTKSTKSVIDNAGVVRRIYCLLYNIQTEYTLLGKVQNAAAEYGCIAGNIEYTDIVRLQYYVPFNLNNFCNIINEATNGSAAITKTDEGRYIDVK